MILQHLFYVRPCDGEGSIEGLRCHGSSMVQAWGISIPLVGGSTEASLH